MRPEEILGVALARSPEAREAAFLMDGERALFVTTEKGAHPCVSAPVRLIQAIHGAFPERARAITRARIHATTVESAAARGTVKVAAKRMNCGLSATFMDVPGSTPELLEVPLAEPGPFFETEILIPEGDGARLALVLELADGVERKADSPLHESDRAVAALLVSREGRCLGWAPNRNALNRTQHAEVNLVQGYLARYPAGLPPGASVYVSLKPCKMCAGMLWDAAAEIRSLRVVYALDDPGPKARNTVLDRASAARMQAAAGKSALLELGLLTGPLTLASL